MGQTAGCARQNTYEASPRSLTSGHNVRAAAAVGGAAVEKEELLCVSLAEGDVGSREAPRELRPAPPTTYEPDQARAPIRGDRTSPFLRRRPSTVSSSLLRVGAIASLLDRWVLAGRRSGRGMHVVPGTGLPVAD